MQNELVTMTGLKEMHENNENVLRNHMEVIAELASKLVDSLTDKDQLKIADDILFWATINKKTKERLEE